MASLKFPNTFSMMGNTCTDKLCTAATVHFLWAKWFVHACHYKGFACSNYKGSDEHEQSIGLCQLCPYNCERIIGRENHQALCHHNK